MHMKIDGSGVDTARRGTSMPTYVVNKNAQPNGDHEVHDEASTRGCLPDVSNRVSLGFFLSCSGAVSEANRRGYRPANGCYYCANACHTR